MKTPPRTKVKLSLTNNVGKLPSLPPRTLEHCFDKVAKRRSVNFYGLGPKFASSWKLPRSKVHSAPKLDLVTCYPHQWLSNQVDEVVETLRYKLPTASMVMSASYGVGQWKLRPPALGTTEPKKNKKDGDYYEYTVKKKIRQFRSDLNSSI